MKVDVCFRVNGKEIPADHGYSLYSALSKRFPWLHDSQEVGIHPISGRPVAGRKIALTPTSRLILRLSSEEIKDVLKLAGEKITVGSDEIRLGVPDTRNLVPAAKLYSRLSVIKGFMEPEDFLEAARKQLLDLGIKGEPSLVDQPQVAKTNEGRSGGSHSPYLRRTINIHDKEIVGFAVRVEELSAEEAIILQEKGIGGRRKMGCGIFIPDRR